MVALIVLNFKMTLPAPLISFMVHSVILGKTYCWIYWTCICLQLDVKVLHTLVNAFPMEEQGGTSILQHPDLQILQGA